MLAKKKERETQYDYFLEVVHQRLESSRNALTDVEVYYIGKYNNVKVVDGNLSKWGILEQARKEI